MSSEPDKRDHRKGDNRSDDQIATAALIKAVPARSEAPRCITPKGPLFPNLGEAHQAITSRLASRSAGHHIVDTALQSSSSTNVSGRPGQIRAAETLPSTRQMGFSERALPVPERSLTPFLGTQSTCAGLATTPSDPSPVVSPFTSSSGDINSSQSNLNNGSRHVVIGSEPLGTGATGRTVEDIYNHYASFSVAASSSSNGIPLSAAVSDVLMEDRYSHRSTASLGSVNVRLPEIRRVDSGIKPGESILHICDAAANDPANESSETPLAEVPPLRRKTQNSVIRPDTGRVHSCLPAQSLDFAADFQELLCESTNRNRVNKLASTSAIFAANNNSGLLFPDIITEQESANFSSSSNHTAQQNQGDQAKHEDDNPDQCGGDGDSDEDQDPFEYDRRSFTLFLKPAREREVSRALRCVSSDSTASAGQLFLPLRVEENAIPRAFSSNNPFLNKLQDYPAPTVNYNWDEADDSSYPHEVKITIQPPPVPPNSPVQQTARLSVIAEKFGSQSRKNRRTLMSDTGDWETVVSTVGQFDDRFESNRALPSTGSFGWIHPVKTTGSSIADYSDTSSFYAPSFNEAASTERIIQRPAASYHPEPGLRRTLRDTNRPVFLPKPRIHRVNGYLQNSSTTRMFSNQTTGSSGNSTRSALVERLGASMRNRNAKKLAQRQDQFQAMNRFSKSRFESLSSISSTDSEAEQGEEAMVTGREKQSSFGANVALLPSPLPHEPLGATHREPSKRAETPQANKPASLDSPNLFSFPLISLQEAAKREVLKRTAEDDNATVTSGGRTRKNSSMDASKATQRTTPLTPLIAKPTPTHSRKPTTFSMFCNGPSDAAQDFVMGHHRGLSNVTGRQSADPLIDGRRSTQSYSVHNPTNSNGDGTLRNRYPFVNGHYIFPEQPRLIPRDKRHLYRQQQQGSNGVAPSLRQIAAMGQGISPFDMPSEDAYISWEARRRRQIYFYFLCCLCVLPFFAVLVCQGTFNNALSWYTRGETGELTRRQRRNIKIVAVVFGIIWLMLLVAFITVLAMNKQSGVW
ncbi:hypothetical protein VTI74DRAFT_7562 [Chaetomium olivicolor]